MKCKNKTSQLFQAQEQQAVVRAPPAKRRPLSHRSRLSCWVALKRLYFSLHLPGFYFSVKHTKETIFLEFLMGTQWIQKWTFLKLFFSLGVIKILCKYRQGRVQKQSKIKWNICCHFRGQNLLLLHELLFLHLTPPASLHLSTVR